MKFSITIEYHSSNKNNAQKTAEVIKKLLEQVPEQKINQLHELLQKRPNLINEILEKLNNPVVKKFFG